MRVFCVFDAAHNRFIAVQTFIQLPLETIIDCLSRAQDDAGTPLVAVEIREGGAIHYLADKKQSFKTWAEIIGKIYTYVETERS